MTARPVALALFGVLAVGACSAPSNAPTPTPTSAPTLSVFPMPTYAADSTIGELTADFPTEFATLPADSEVIASAARAEADITRISLTLRSTLSPAEISAAYDTLLTGLGFTAVPTSTPQGLAAITTYTRTAAGPSENVTVAVLDDGATRSVSVSGDVVPAAPVP